MIYGKSFLSYTGGHMINIFWSIFIISLVGVLETLYLIHKRRLADHPICPMGGRCDIVLSSKYNKTLGVHNDIAGLMFYLFFVVWAVLFLFEHQFVLAYKNIIMIVSSAVLIVATLMSLGFIYLQWRVIKAWCFWCLMSAGTVFLLDLVVFSWYK